KGPGLQPNPAREAALLRIEPITTGVREADHPAMASDGSRVWLVWVSYAEGEHSTRIFARSYENGKWSEPVELSEAPGDYSKPAVAMDAHGVVWVAWPAQVRGNWDIYGRVLRKTWSKTE